MSPRVPVRPPDATDPLGSVAMLFASPDAPKPPMVVDVGDGWGAPDLSTAPGLVWGRAPLPARAARGRALRATLARERALRRGRRMGLTVVRVPPALIKLSGARGRLRSLVRAGAVLVDAAPGGTVFDVLAREAGLAATPRRIRIGAGGSVIARAHRADGTEIVLRAGPAWSPSDPRREGRALDALTAAGIIVAPKLVASGVSCGLAWTLATALPGRRPGRLTPALVRRVVGELQRFPHAAGPPRAFTDDLALIAAKLPARAAAILRLRDDVEPLLAPLGSVWRHGDLWLGNVIARRGAVHLVDWDAWHDRGVPGGDLMQLVVTEQRRRAHIGIGEAWRARVWRTVWPADATAGLVGAADQATLDAVGTAWWASAVAGTLRRLPRRAGDDAWLAANVDTVLSAS